MGDMLDYKKFNLRGMLCLAIALSLPQQKLPSLETGPCSNWFCSAFPLTLTGILSKICRALGFRAASAILLNAEHSQLR